ncbi:MAG: DUF977 family protein [Minisyncoccia bacterium]
MTDEVANTSPETPPEPPVVEVTAPESAPVPIEEVPVSAEVVVETAPVVEAIPVSQSDAPTEIAPPEPSPVSVSSNTTPTTSTLPVSPPPPPPTKPGIATYRAKALEKRTTKKQARLEKVVALARERGKITNNDVQILHGVSDATASRYLRELATTGRLTRVGKQKRPFYEPV